MTIKNPMSIKEACQWILGRARADSITRDMGIRWTISAAIAAARTTDKPEALAALRPYRRGN